MPSRHWRRLLLRVAVTSALALWLAWLNIFNADKASGVASANVFLRLAAPVGSINHRLRDEPIVVVRFDEYSLRTLGLTWPLDFNGQASLLRSLAGYKPQSIFFDLAFYQPRDGVDAFAGVIKTATGSRSKFLSCFGRTPGRIPEHAIPVFLAKVPGKPVLDKFCEAGAEAVLVGWKSEPNIYPLRACDSAPDTASDKSCTDARQDTAATRLWREICSRHPKDRQGYKCSGSRNFEDNRTFSLTWGLTGPPQLASQPSSRSCERTRFEQWGLEFAAMFGFVRQDAVYYSECPPAEIIPVEDIMQCDDPICTKRLALALQNKIAIVGADLPGLRDRLPSPVHQLLPGAFTHAQALDNLLRYGSRVFTAQDDYFTDEFRWFPTVHELTIFCLIFATLSLSTLAIFWSLERWVGKTPSLRAMAYFDKRPGRAAIRHALRTIGVLLGLAIGLTLFLIAATAILFWGLHEAPLNWTKILTISVLSAPDEIAPAMLFAVVVLLFTLPFARKVARFFLDPPHKESSDEMDIP